MLKTVCCLDCCESAAHIEVQIIADRFGNVYHLYHRDCSIQSKQHQKIMELAPANLPPKLHEAITSDAVRMMNTINYQGAGTVEFLVRSTKRDDAEYFFLEVNPRLQVEHTVTEEVTGFDIVLAQLKLAGGASLAELGIKRQNDVQCVGFAAQARVGFVEPGEFYRVQLMALVKWILQVQ